MTVGKANTEQGEEVDAFEVLPNELVYKILVQRLHPIWQLARESVNGGTFSCKQVILLLLNSIQWADLLQISPLKAI